MRLLGPSSAARAPHPPSPPRCARSEACGGIRVRPWTGDYVQDGSRALQRRCPGLHALSCVLMPPPQLLLSAWRGSNRGFSLLLTRHSLGILSVFSVGLSCEPPSALCVDQSSSLRRPCVHRARAVLCRQPSLPQSPRRKVSPQIQPCPSSHSHYIVTDIATPSYLTF